MKAIIIDNSSKKKSLELRKIINKNYPHFQIIKTKHPKEIPHILNQALIKNINLIISAGGDGTINKIINEVTKLKKTDAKKINLAVLPCGKANDLASNFNIPNDLQKALTQILNGKKRKIDIIKVNDNYFITGGGLGLPAEIVKDVNNLPRTLGESIYLWLTLKKFIFGYKGIENMQNKLLAIYILNQSFIGKRFNMAPEAKNNDGYLRAKFVGMPPTFLSNFKTLYKGSNGKIDELSWVKKEKTKKLIIKLKKPSYFMGDGELLEKNNEFAIGVIPKAINFIY